jgi:hypothetical protein
LAFAREEERWPREGHNTAFERRKEKKRPPAFSRLEGPGRAIISVQVGIQREAARSSRRKRSRVGIDLNDHRPGRSGPNVVVR